MLKFVTISLLYVLTTAAWAHDNPRTILVLDGSGSMWGQIDGTAKITIAQEVVSARIPQMDARFFTRRSVIYPIIQ